MKIVDAEQMERVRLRHALEVADELMTAQMSVTGSSEYLALRHYRQHLRRLREGLGNDGAENTRITESAA